MNASVWVLILILEATNGSAPSMVNAGVFTGNDACRLAGQRWDDSSARREYVCVPVPTFRGVSRE